GDLDPGDPRGLADPLEQLLRDPAAFVERLPRVPCLGLPDPVQDELLRPLAESLQAADPSLAGDPLEVVEVLHVQLANEDGRLARPEPGDPHQVERTERELLAQIIEEAEPPGGDELGDLLRDRLADSVR